MTLIATVFPQLAICALLASVVTAVLGMSRFAAAGLVLTGIATLAITSVSSAHTDAEEAEAVELAVIEFTASPARK